MTKAFKIFIILFATILVAYLSLSTYAYRMSSQTGGIMYHIKGVVVHLGKEDNSPWGIRADWNMRNLLAIRRLRFDYLPIEFRQPGQRVEVEYQTQDVIGGEWGIIIRILSIKKIE